MREKQKRCRSHPPTPTPTHQQQQQQALVPAPKGRDTPPTHTPTFHASTPPPRMLTTSSPNPSVTTRRMKEAPSHDQARTELSAQRHQSTRTQQRAGHRTERTDQEAHIPILTQKNTHPLKRWRRRRTRSRSRSYRPGQEEDLMTPKRSVRPRPLPPPRVDEHRVLHTAHEKAGIQAVPASIDRTSGTPSATSTRRCVPPSTATCCRVSHIHTVDGATGRSHMRRSSPVTPNALQSRRRQPTSPSLVHVSRRHTSATHTAIALQHRNRCNQTPIPQCTASACTCS
jgi:hypothetical protein